MAQLPKLQYYPLPETLHQQTEAYLQARDQEQRLLPDDVVRMLPAVPQGHPYYEEWRARQASLKRLISFLSKEQPQGKVLDLGCGNGWMSYALVQKGFEVCGLEVNTQEIEQAARVFEHDRLHWIRGNVEENLPIGPFDAIIISAALQYFPDPAALMRHLKSYLNHGGGIMVMDTFLYPEAEASDAQARSKAYFSTLGVEAMTTHYHHHQATWLAEFKHQFVYRPSLKQKVLRKLGQAVSPFPMVWITP